VGVYFFAFFGFTGGADAGCPTFGLGYIGPVYVVRTGVLAQQLWEQRSCNSGMQGGCGPQHRATERCGRGGPFKPGVGLSGAVPERPNLEIVGVLFVRIH